MRTVTLEFRTGDLELLGLIPPNIFERYEEVELLETLRMEKGWRLQLLRVRRRGPLRTAAELERESRRIRRLYGFTEFELVERRPRTRDYVILVRQKNPEALGRLFAASAGRLAPTTPFRITPETVTASFHGDEAAIRRVLTALRRDGLPFTMRRAAPSGRGRDGGDAAITERQRDVLARAWSLGYWTIPRRVTLTRLAQLTGQSPPALGKMLRRAERRLVAGFLAEGGGLPEPESAGRES